MKEAFFSLDASFLGFEGFTEVPFHFSVVFNPFVQADDPNSAIVSVYRKFMPDEIPGGRGNNILEGEGKNLFSDILALLLAPFDFIYKLLARFSYSIATKLVMDGNFNGERKLGDVAAFTSFLWIGLRGFDL